MTQSIRYTIPIISTYITHEKIQSIRYTIPTLSTYVTMRRFNQSDIQYRPYLHMLPWEDSVNQIYNTDHIYICYQEKTPSIRYTIPTLSGYATMRRLSQSDIQYRPYLHMLPREDSVNRYTIPTLSTYITMRRFNQSDIQYRPYLHMLPWEDSVNQIYNTDHIYICYQEKTPSIRYTIPTLSAYATMRRLSQSDIQYRPYLHMLWREDSVNQIYNTDPICICYHEKTQSIRYTIPTLSTYVTKRRLSQTDIQYRPYLHILPMRRLSQSDIQYIPYLHILPMRRFSQSDIQYRPYLHMLPREDSVKQIYNTDPIYIYYPWEDSVNQIYNTYPIYIYYPWEDSVNQIYNTDHIYICYHEKTQSIRYTIPTISTYVTKRRLRQSDIQYRPYLDMLPWEDSVNQIYNTDPIYICYQEKTQSIDIQYRPYLHILPMRRFNQSDIQYRPYLHMLPWEDSVNQIYNTDHIYICYQEKTPSIRYTIPTLSAYATMRRLSQSNIQYRPYLHMLWREDSVNQIYNTDPICICYHEKTQSIRYTIPTISTYVTKRRLSQTDIQYRPYLHILPMRRLSQSDIQYIPYLHILPMRRFSQSDIQYRPYLHIWHEKTQSIRYTIPTISTYITMRRLSSSDTQYRPYLHKLPWDDSVNQIYNTDHIYIYYHEKTQSIRYTIPTLSAYATMRRPSQSDIQYRPYLHMLPREDSVNRYTIPTLSTYITHEKTQSIRYTIPTLSGYATMRRLSQSDIQYRPYLHMLWREESVNQIYNTDPICICYHEKTQSIRYTIPTLSTYVTKRRLSQSDIQYRPYLHILPMRRLSQSDIQYRPYLHILPMSRISQSDIQYRPYLHMLPWEDSINQIYNTDPIYIYYHEKTQSIRYTIPTLSTYVTKRRLSQSDLQYRPYLHILPMRRLSQSDIQYRPYLNMLPWEDSVDQIYNTDPIYIYYHEKTKFIRYTIPTLSTYVTLGWLSRSDVQYRPYLHMLPWEHSVDQIYKTDPIYIYYHEKTKFIRYAIEILSTYATLGDSADQMYNTDLINIYYHEKTQSIR